MNILMRLDCGSTLGTGHLMRCLTLAQSLQQQGAQISFVLRQLANNKSVLLREAGFTVYEIAAADELTDAEATIQLIQHQQLVLDWIVVDHYGLTAQWESLLRPYTKQIMAIDDLANRSHDCDLLLDQNIDAEQHSRYQTLLSAKTHLLLGPTYALLRPAFREYRAAGKRRDGHIQRILISFGGGECTTETLQALQACAALNQPALAIDVVVGAACTQRASIEKKCADLPYARYFCETTAMAELMAAADLAIGAGGSTTWERCCLGLPSIVLTLAENQQQITDKLAALGVLQYLGKKEQVTETSLTTAVADLLKQPQRVATMSQKAAALVDGNGCQRVTERMMTT